MSADDAYFTAISAGLNPTLLAAAKEIGTGFLYQDSFATDRNAVISACHAHEGVLRRLLQIKQVPDLTKIERAIQQYYVPVGFLAINSFMYFFFNSRDTNCISLTICPCEQLKAANSIFAKRQKA